MSVKATHSHVLLCVCFCVDVWAHSWVLACVSCVCGPGEENLLAILKRRWWKYMLLGLVDIEANYLVIKAYQYTTLTSVQVSLGALGPGVLF